MFSKPSDWSRVNLSCDGSVSGGRASHQTGLSIRIENLGKQEIAVVRKILDIAADPHAQWEMVTEELGARYAHTEHAQLAAQLIERIATVGVEQTYKELGAYSNNMIQDARGDHYQKIRKVTDELAAAATVLGNSRNEVARRRAPFLTELKARIEEAGPYIALDEIDIQIRPPLSTCLFERVTCAYIASMFCENPVDALEFMLDESASKVMHYIEAEYLQERFARYGDKFISDRDMRELARKVL